MTGTAKTEEDEFREIYNVDVIEVPTNKPVIREDLNDGIYSTLMGKYMAAIEDIKECHAKGQPVLVGTTSIEKSEVLSQLLKKEKIKHEVLNAKLHEKESEIVAQAGRFGAVTIATNMAGRGTDIVLGGNPEFMAKLDLKKQGYEPEIIEAVDSFVETDDEEINKAKKEYHALLEKHKKETEEEAKKVIAAGGLHIIGTERHESRRIDNQLRGRSGRQGDPGSSRFYISADDDLIKLFAGERFKTVMDKAKVEEGESIESPILTRLIESAQKQVEANNFSIRKNVLKYDDVMNKQREVIYTERRKVLEGEDLSTDISNMRNSLIDEEVDYYFVNGEQNATRDVDGLLRLLIQVFGFEENELKKISFDADLNSVKEELKKLADKKYEEKEQEFSKDVFREVERIILLQVVDNKWMDHIDAMDQMRKGMNLRAMGNEDPVRAYQNEGFDMFEAMNKSIREDTVKALFHVVNPEKMERKRVATNLQAIGGDEPVKQKPFVRKTKKIGRNDPCPCGSGKKYKNCCGR